jgi:hypothetical protein
VRLLHLRSTLWVLWIVRPEGLAWQPGEAAVIGRMGRHLAWI